MEKRSLENLEPLGPGDDLGTYRIHRRLRSPPETELYQAGDRRNPELFLIRLEVFVPEAEAAEAFAMRWREMMPFTRFMHPRILRLWQLGIEGRRHYAAMPWLSARSLLACLEEDRGQPWPVDAALSVARDIALGLGALHQWRLDGHLMKRVYGVVNPETLLIAAQGDALLRPAPLADPLQGANRLISFEQINHMSPEATLARPLTPASDVASLGSVLYRLLAGIQPYPAPSRIEVVELIRAGQFSPLRSLRPDLPVQVEELVHRTMAMDPSERPADGEVLAKEIEILAAELGLTLGAKAVRSARRVVSQRKK